MLLRALFVAMLVSSAGAERIHMAGDGRVKEQRSASPVIIVPGTAGSQLEARLDKPSVRHFYCSRKSDWYTLWLSVTNLVPPAVNCWCDNIRLLWNSNQHTYSNNLGVSTRTPGWGDTATVEYLDPSLKAGDSAYFHALVNALVTRGGLVRNISVRAAPYDFRRAPNAVADGESQTWVDKMVQLVEDTYHANGGERVALVSHSMGCLFTLHLLNTQSV